MTTKTNRTRTQRMKILFMMLFGAAVVVAIVGGLVAWKPSLFEHSTTTVSAAAPAAAPAKASATPFLLGSISAPKCDGGYNIVGAAVTIRNEKNEVIASETTVADRGRTTPDHCVANFSTTLPKAKFYQVQIGSHAGPSYSYDDLATQGFSMNLDLK